MDTKNSMRFRRMEFFKMVGVIERNCEHRGPPHTRSPLVICCVVTTRLLAMIHFRSRAIRNFNAPRIPASRTFTSFILTVVNEIPDKILEQIRIGVLQRDSTTYISKTKPIKNPRVRCVEDYFLHDIPTVISEDAGFVECPIAVGVGTNGLLHPASLGVLGLALARFPCGRDTFAIPQRRD